MKHHERTGLKQQRQVSSDTNSNSNSQPRVLKAWLRQIVDRVVAHSPRLVCANCNQSFYAAEIEVKISHGGVHEECPRCQADSFRLASSESADRRVRQH